MSNRDDDDDWRVQDTVRQMRRNRARFDHGLTPDDELDALDDGDDDGDGCDVAARN